jgi:acyl dehydratase
MTGFDPATHRMVPQQRWFEDFTLGERFIIPGRTMTSAVFAAFHSASGDTHPVHYDAEYCRARGMPNLLAHGFQTLIHTAPGAGLFPFLVEESLVGFLEQSSRFLKPVFADDTIYPALEVTELTPARTTGVVGLRSTVFNQRRELVLEGLQKFLIRRRPTSRNLRSRVDEKRTLNEEDWLTAKLARQSAPNAKKARKYWPFAVFSAGRGCRSDAPALPMAHEIP